jgi:hypothetical protein
LAKNCSIIWNKKPQNRLKVALPCTPLQQNLKEKEKPHPHASMQAGYAR